MRSPFVALTAFVALALVAPAEVSPPCTPIPALYQDWKARTPWSQEADSVVRARVDVFRSRVTFDPFDAVIAADSATRTRKGERVLWEDDSLMVIVAKPAMPRDALVIPKLELMFPGDASEWLIGRLARAAAATSDAFMRTSGKECDSAYASRIFVNPPDAIGVRHLHVHVQPPPTIAIRDEHDFYDRMRRHLAEALAEGASPHRDSR
jgi:diadenosine tetraphosphate (Ap4A) HIT family hydrolase